MNMTLRNTARRFTDRLEAVLGLFALMLVVQAAWAVNAPTITHLQYRPVLPGVPNFASTTANVVFQGNAEAGTTIRLFRAGTQVGTGVTAGSGQWTVTLVTASEVKANYDADASDGTFTSAKCPAVDVHIDAHAPNLNMLPSWGAQQYAYYYLFSTSYYYHNISEWGGTAGSGIDFTTASMTIRDITANTVIPVNLTNNLIDRVDFAPQPNDTALKVNAHTYMVWFQISDKAKNTVIASRTFICDTIAPTAPTVLKIYDPMHNQFTGTGETAANTPDAGGYVNYFSGMTIATQPTAFRGTVSNPTGQDAGTGTYQVNPNYGQSCTLANALMDATGSWTSKLSYTFFTGQTFWIYAYDPANNQANSNISLNFNNPLPNPTNFKVLDPGHHVFSGTGEPTTNLPDAEGYIDYYPYMSISSQPTILKGFIATSSFYYMYFYVPTGSGWSGPAHYVGTQINATTGSFSYPLTTIPDGSYSVQWIFINNSYMSGSKYIYLKFIDGPPPPPNNITSCNYSSWNY